MIFGTENPIDKFKKAIAMLQSEEVSEDQSLYLMVPHKADYTELYAELRTLENFRADVKELLRGTEHVTKEHGLDGYLEDLLVDTDYTISELEEKIALLDPVVVS